MILTYDLHAPREIVLRPGEHESVTIVGAYLAIGGAFHLVIPTNPSTGTSQLALFADHISFTLSHTAPTVPIALVDHMIGVMEGNEEVAGLEDAWELYLNDVTIRLLKGQELARLIVFDA